MPKMAATTLWPMAAAQIAAMNRPAAVAARMMASGAPAAVAGTTPTSPRPRATEPTMKLGNPRMVGSPASGPVVATSAAAVSASIVVIAAPLTGSRQEPHHRCGLLKTCLPRLQRVVDLSLNRPSYRDAGCRSPAALLHRALGCLGGLPRVVDADDAVTRWLAVVRGGVEADFVPVGVVQFRQDPADRREVHPGVRLTERG